MIKLVLASYSIQEIVTRARRVRFLFIEEEGILESEKGKGFIKSLNTITKLFPENYFKVIGSSALIITKTRAPNSINLIKRLRDDDLIDDPQLRQALDDIFLLKEATPNVFSFGHPYYCKEQVGNEFEESTDITQHTEYNQKKVDQLLKYTKTGIDELIKKLETTSIPKINTLSLLSSETEDLIRGVFKVIFYENIQEHVQKFVQTINNCKDRDIISKTLDDLNKDTLYINFYSNLNKQIEFSFLEKFDSELYKTLSEYAHKTYLKQSNKELKERAQKKSDEIHSKILEEEKENEIKLKNKVIDIQGTNDKQEKKIKELELKLQKIKDEQDAEKVKEEKNKQRIIKVKEGLEFKGVNDEIHKLYGTLIGFKSNLAEEERRIKNFIPRFMNFFKKSIKFTTMEDELKEKVRVTKHDLDAQFKKYLDLVDEKHTFHDKI